MQDKLSDSIGLTKQESQIFVSLLSIGKSSATAIAKSAKLNRTTVYYSLERLIEKGLVSYIDITGVRFFKAINPELLAGFIETQKKEAIRTFQEKENLLKEVIPKLKILQNIPHDDIKIEVLEGRQAAKTYFEKTFRIIIEEDIDELLSVNMIGTGFLRESFKYERDSIVKKALKDLKGKKIDVKWLLIGPKDKEDKEEISKFIGERKYVYSKEKVLTNTHVYGDYLDIIIVQKKPVIITIKNRYSADTFRAMFNVIWNFK